ncbi:hypothetical protein [uncultured Arthrobacter sp.]|uniref:hypothetical protein n=1 Tax=uncultured Arthrobacter sp. TaxID=114050 RepID=UPI0028D6F3E6|nr:hypothetical protein [uncultured Arthrobacter sp.]
MPKVTPTTVHHLYARPSDLLPICGAVPGPEGLDWNTGHAAEVLVAFAAQGSACCSLCLELAASSS